MKIAVVMFYNERIKAYGEITHCINKKYCEKHNLDFIVSHTPRYRYRHPAWERLPLLLAHISKYDYLIWIDADAYFYSDAPNIAEIIAQNSTHNFIFSNDRGDTNINTGILIVKNSQYSINFLTRWAYDEELYINNPIPGFWDQGVLIDMYNKNILDIKSNSIIFNYGFFQHFSKDELTTLSTKPYVYHLAGKDFPTRCYETREYLYEHYGTCKFMENKRYTWENNHITFLKHYKLNAFGEGHYMQQGTHIFEATFGGSVHTLVFNDDYTEFASMRHSDNAVVKGRLVV
jgi:hypothetical protein